MYAIRFVKFGDRSETVFLDEPVIPDERELWVAVVAGRAMLGRDAPEADGFQVFLRETGERVHDEWI